MKLIVKVAACLSKSLFVLVELTVWAIRYPLLDMLPVSFTSLDKIEGRHLQIITFFWAN
jgi:hypothetical protein